MNKDSPIGKLFTSFPRYGERFIDTRKRSKITNHDLLFEIVVFLNNFPLNIVVTNGES